MIKEYTNKKDNKKYYMIQLYLGKDEITGKDRLLNSIEAMNRTYEQVKDYYKEFSLENIY